MLSDSVCNHTSDNKIGRPRSGITSMTNWTTRVVISHKITISEKRRISRYEKGKFALKVFTLFLW